MDSFITQTPTNSFQQRSVLTKDDFTRKYWFNHYQSVLVVNPLKYDYPFMAEGRHFMIKTGDRRELPGPIANVYLSMVTRIMAQDDDNLGFMGDPNLAHLYYDKLIVEVTSSLPDLDNTPAYLRNISPEIRGEAPSETAPWDTSVGERARDVAGTLPPQPIQPDIQPSLPPTPAKAAAKEFELDGLKYKLSISDKGNKMYQRNGKIISAADYNKAASML